MGILRLIKTDKNARKIFGAKELKIIEKQLFGVRLTQSEKNRLSRDIRRKFRFIKEAAKFEGDFEIEKSAETKKIVAQTIKDILNYNNRDIKRIILFGSVVERNTTLRSDIDIAIDFKKISLRRATIIRKSLLGILPPKVDIQIYNILSKKIKKEIDEKGKIIYERKN